MTPTTPTPPMPTWLTRRFGLTVPVICAPMAGVASGRLAAAVSAAGGLGMIGVGPSTPPEWITEECAVASAAGRPYGVGLLAWALAERTGQLPATLAARPALVSISFGPYERHLPAVRDAGIPVATQVGTVAEARAAERAGVDLVVARGAEGGGHGRDEVGTLPLLQLVLDAVGVPVVAAGGVSTARGLAAVLAAGAAGAWVGTAFLACPEADLPPPARRRVLAAAETDTGYGRVFDVAGRLGWPAAYGGRALRNPFFDRWNGRERELAGDDGAAGELTAARRSGDFDVAPIYAGQAVGQVDRERAAAEVIAEFAGAAALLRRAADGR